MSSTAARRPPSESPSMSSESSSGVPMANEKRTGHLPSGVGFVAPRLVNGGQPHRAAGPVIESVAEPQSARILLRSNQFFQIPNPIRHARQHRSRRPVATAPPALIWVARTPAEIVVRYMQRDRRAQI